MPLKAHSTDLLRRFSLCKYPAVGSQVEPPSLLSLGQHELSRDTQNSWGLHTRPTPVALFFVGRETASLCTKSGQLGDNG